MPPPTLTRLADNELQAIVRRLQTPMTPEGLQNWYPRDIRAMSDEIQALRIREADISAILRRLPLEGVDGSLDSPDALDVARRAAAFYSEYQEGLWREREVNRLRRQIDKHVREAEAAADRETGLRSAIEALTAESNELAQANGQLSQHVTDQAAAIQQANLWADEQKTRIRLLEEEATRRDREYAVERTQLRQDLAEKTRLSDQWSSRAQRATALLSQSVTQVTAVLRED